MREFFFEEYQDSDEIVGLHDQAVCILDESLGASEIEPVCHRPMALTKLRILIENELNHLVRDGPPMTKPPGDLPDIFGRVSSLLDILLYLVD